MDNILDFLKFFSYFDLIYFAITVLSLIKCYKKGFVLSLLSASKWLFAYVVTLFLFPKAKPFVEDIIDNESSYCTFNNIQIKTSNSKIKSKI